MNEKQIRARKYYVGGLWLSKDQLTQGTVVKSKGKLVTKPKVEIIKKNKDKIKGSLTELFTPTPLTDLQKYQRLKDIHNEMRTLGIKQREHSARIRQLAQQIGDYI